MLCSGKGMVCLWHKVSRFWMFYSLNKSSLYCAALWPGMFVYCGALRPFVWAAE